MAEWIGKTIGRVRIEKLLARGGMAEVYLGSHLTLERPVAVKLLHSFIEEEPMLIERFHREAKVVAGLRHSHIVQIFDFDTVDGHPYIVMEYLKGPTLATYLRHLHQRKRRIGTDQVARVLNELSAALDYAHGQGVIHRDIKPGNIMLHKNSEDIPLDRPLTNDVEAVITDFGLVRIMNAASQTVSGTVSGTPAYMSPEQARGDTTDHRTDIYSLGIVLYEMLAGRVPFEADSTLTVLHMQIHTTPAAIPGIPAEVQAVIDRALQKNPNDRYQTSRELAKDYYRSIGMVLKADTLRDPYPVRAAPLEATAPPKPEIAPKPEQQIKPERIAEPKPPTKPESTPEPEPQAKSEPTTAAESIAEPKPATPSKRKLVTKRKPYTKHEPIPKPVPQTRPEPAKKLEPAIKPEPASKPSRSGAGIGIILASVIGLAVLAVAGYLIFGRGPNVPKPTETVSPQTPSTPTGPLPSPTPGLPIPDGMVNIAAGTYKVGKDPAGPYQSARQSITLSEFWIDQYQVTNQDFQQFMPEWPIPSGQEKYPVMGVRWEQADAYCTSKSKRLPSEAEWEAAGRGSGENPPLYPWGQDASQALQLPNHTYEVGTFAFNVSSLGVFDMLGNVYEWVGEPYGSLTAGNRLLRGGRYGVPVDLAFRAEVAPDDTKYAPYAGFRCAASQVR